MREKAFSLLELLVAAFIFALLGGALIRAHSSGDVERKLELAASEVASALRFARSEAIRTGDPHGAWLSDADDRIRVFQLDVSTLPGVAAFSVTHPVDKKLYDLALAKAPFTSGVEVTQSRFRFGGNSKDFELVVFASSGTPVSPDDLAVMDEGSVVVEYGDDKRVIAVAPMTGRVTVQ
jgi:Tfp pilus assembly protein FimT